MRTDELTQSPDGLGLVALEKARAALERVRELGDRAKHECQRKECNVKSLQLLSCCCLLLFGEKEEKTTSQTERRAKRATRHRTSINEGTPTQTNTEVVVENCCRRC